MRYSRRGQKEYSVLKEADARQTSDKFIPLVVDGLKRCGLWMSSEGCLQ